MTWFPVQKERWDNRRLSQHQQKSVTSNCANVDDIQCESIGTEDVLSMCVVPVNVQHSQLDKEIITIQYLQPRNICHTESHGAVKH